MTEKRDIYAINNNCSYIYFVNLLVKVTLRSSVLEKLNLMLLTYYGSSRFIFYFEAFFSYF